MDRLRLVASAACIFGVCAIPLLAAVPAAAATTTCKSVVKAGSGSAKKIRATSMPCAKARTVAKTYIGTFTPPSGYTCRSTHKGFAGGQLLYDVRCTRKKGAGRLTFRMATAFLPPTGAAPPSANGGT